MKRKVRQTRAEHRRGPHRRCRVRAGRGPPPPDPAPRHPPYFPSPSQASSASRRPACREGGRERGGGPRGVVWELAGGHWCGPGTARPSGLRGEPCDARDSEGTMASEQHLQGHPRGSPGRARCLWTEAFLPERGRRPGQSQGLVTWEVTLDRLSGQGCL